MHLLQPIAHVRARRRLPTDDRWGGTTARLVLVDGLDPDCLAGLADFSHVEVIYGFHLVAEADVEHGRRHPRGNPAWPSVGIFAQRAKGRPNRLGLSTVRIVAVEGGEVTVAELDAIDGTPVYDLKPVMAEFLPRGEIRQPAWSRALMAEYWAPEG